MVEIKFCGMMRPEDARQAVALGARYVGVILADGPRVLTDDAALAVLAPVDPACGVGRVGVFGALSAEQVAVRADRLDLDVAQLHGDPDARAIAELRRLWSGHVWAVQRIKGSTIPATLSELFDVADAVVLDARVPGKLGGTGVSLPWDDLRESMEPFRTRRARLVVAGGLRPSNVASAVDALHPDVVDVSSGVEARVGVKDHTHMRAFRDAVRGVRTR
jgi:phosphoribosylanthranilate isomerase